MRAFRSNLIKIAVFLVLAAGTLGSAQAQQGQTLATLPPALRAAILSGNSNAVSQAISTLSGGNQAQAAALAAGAIGAAEQLLSTNPAAAIAVAGAAVQIIQPSSVQLGAPTQAETVLTTAARIFSSPAAVRALPEQAAALATAAVRAAVTNASATIIGNVSNAAVRVAEQILQNNPSAAVTLASLTVSSVQNLPVQQGAPTQTLDIVATAARILIQPAAQLSPVEPLAALASSILTVAGGSIVQQQTGGAAVLNTTNSYLQTNGQIASQVSNFTNATQTPTQQTQTQTQSPLTPAERFNDTRPPSEENILRRASPT